MKKSIALIGAGPLGLGFVLQMAESLKNGAIVDVKSIDIFDSYGKYGLGAGLPYDPQTTDFEHLFNVVSESVNIDEKTNFKQWLEANGSEIKTKFEKIHQQRFEEKFVERFGIKFDENSSLNEEQQGLKDGYEKIWRSIEDRYLNFDGGTKYHPRILFGVRNILLFEKAVEEIKAGGVAVHLHPQTEITSLDKVENDPDFRVQLEARTSEETEISAKFSDVILATGRWRIQDKSRAKHVPEVWPIEEFKKNLLEIIQAEIKARKESGDSDKVIKVAIQGQSLTAIDAVKTMLDGCGEEFKDYEIKIDMLSRSGVMQQVKGVDGWQKQEKFGGKFPQGTEINQSVIEELAGENGDKFRLWQLMLMTARALENGYRIEGQESQANRAREFVKLIINNVSRNNDVEVSDASFADIDGYTIEQLKKFQKRFGLQLDGAKYEPIMLAFKDEFLSEPAIEQLRSSFAIAELGDIPSGHLMWKSIYGQIDSLGLAPYLTPDESSYRFQILDRVMSAFHNGMPPESAQYLLEKHNMKVLDCWAIGEQSHSGYGKDGKVLITSESGETKFYDAVVSSRGYDMDIANNPSDVAKSIRKIAGFTINKSLWAESAQEYEEKNREMVTRFGEKDSAKMFRKFFQDKEDGKYYYSSGDYRRQALDENGVVIKSPVRELVDLENKPVLSGFIIPFSGSFVGATANGRRVFLEKFVPQKPKTVVSDTSVERVQQKEMQAEKPSHC